jgi:hypothetical protein
MSSHETILGPGGTQKRMLGPGGTEQPRPSSSQYDFSKSNLVLMIGGQILLLVLLLMVVMFGTAPLTFPANAVRIALSNTAKNVK